MDKDSQHSECGFALPCFCKRVYQFLWDPRMFLLRVFVGLGLLVLVGNAFTTISGIFTSPKRLVVIVLGLFVAVACSVYAIFRRKEIVNWLSLLEGGRVQKSILLLVVFLCVIHTLTQRTHYPVTHVGMFEQSNFERLTEDTNIFTPAMYCHYVDGELKIESIRRATFFMEGDLNLKSHTYLGMIYFKWRHTEFVNDLIVEAGKGVGWDMVPMDLTYSLGKEFHILSATPTQLEEDFGKFKEGRIYLKQK